MILCFHLRPWDLAMNQVVMAFDAGRPCVLSPVMGLDRTGKILKDMAIPALGTIIRKVTFPYLLR